MAGTITEKIFSARCGKEVTAGEVVMAPISGAMIHDITGPLAIEKFYEMGGVKVFDPAKIIMLFDHQVPADSLNAAENQKNMRIFAKEQGIYNYDIKEGVCHQVTLEKGRVSPGDIVIAGHLRRQQKKVFLVANKTDGIDADLVVGDFYELGLGSEIYQIAAAHGRGVHSGGYASRMFCCRSSREAMCVTPA